jgi:MgtC family
MNAMAFALQLTLALIFGAAIGAERQWRQRTAGLRTNALVSSGAAMFVLSARLIGAPNDSVLRVAAQVVSGTAGDSSEYGFPVDNLVRILHGIRVAAIDRRRFLGHQ